MLNAMFRQIYDKAEPVETREEVLPKIPRLVEGFDLANVRCASETRIANMLQKDEDLQRRLTGASGRQAESLVQGKLSLLTGTYRVVERTTPSLYKLSEWLKGTLRLVQPLDLHVRGTEERNAFCLPSRSGKRLIMCLNSGLVELLSLHELISVMGHEAGHAILGHGKIPRIQFGHPDFSFLEVARFRALDRRQELSCDRVGLIASGDLRVSCKTLFKLASGLSDRWIDFDESVYAKEFDSIADLADTIEFTDVEADHPMIPLRVAALIAFGRSELYANAVGRSGWEVSAADLEKTTDHMLEMVEPTFPELENASEEAAFNQLVVQGAMLIIGADGVVAPEEVSWFRNNIKGLELDGDFAGRITSEAFRADALARLEPAGRILRGKLSINKRIGLLRVLCDVAVSAGGIPEGESELLDHLRQLLGIPSEFAGRALEAATASAADQPKERLDVVRTGPAQDAAGSKAESPAAKARTSEERVIAVEPAQASEGRSAADQKAKVSDPLDAIVGNERIRDRSRAVLQERCDEFRRRGLPPTTAIRELVAWVITSSGPKGPLTSSQARLVVLAAIDAAGRMKEEMGLRLKTQATPLAHQVRQFGLASLFRKGEVVVRMADDKRVIVTSVSRSRGVIGISDNGQDNKPTELEPHEVRKDPVNDDWPVEFTFA